MELIKKILRVFYEKKYTGSHCVTRILIFKFKTKLSNEKIREIRHSRTLKLYPPNIEKVGKNTYSALDIKIPSPKTEIGSFCSIGSNVQLGHGSHPLSFLSTSSYFYLDEIKWKNPESPSHEEFWELEPVKIGNDVWIGDNVFVKNGITISDGAVIGANAVVTKDVPPYAIVAGNPAKIIRYRFDENTINRLLKLEWWEFDDEILKTVPYDNIEKALEYLENIKK